MVDTAVDAEVANALLHVRVKLSSSRGDLKDGVQRSNVCLEVNGQRLLTGV